VAESELAGFLDPDEAADEWSGEHDPNAYQVLSLDPGGTTGWAVFDVHPEAMGPDPEIPVLFNVDWWTAGQFTGSVSAQCDEIIALIRSWPSARLVTEDFKLRQINAVLTPVEINAIVLHEARPRYFVKQMPSLAMTTAPDERLKAWGFWLPGKEHARDAIRHNITYLKRQKERAVRAGGKVAVRT
jgi:hypothetical protein